MYYDTLEMTSYDKCYIFWHGVFLNYPVFDSSSVANLLIISADKSKFSFL